MTSEARCDSPPVLPPPPPDIGDLSFAKTPKNGDLTTKNATRTHLDLYSKERGLSTTETLSSSKVESSANLRPCFSAKTRGLFRQKLMKRKKGQNSVPKSIIGPPAASGLTATSVSFRLLFLIFKIWFVKQFFIRIEIEKPQLTYVIIKAISFILV